MKTLVIVTLAILLIMPSVAFAGRKNFGHRLLGDLNNDCIVDIFDIGTLNPYYGNSRGTKAHEFGNTGFIVGYRGWADVNKDGTINYDDFMLIAANWANVC